MDIVSAIIYQIVIGPLKIIMEVIYGAAYNILGNAGAAIIPLSLAVNFLLLPFYKRADAIQREERELEKKMAVGLAHIKDTFHGDERYMMQQAYYRVNQYKPIYALRSALPLLLQIPFFIAAYQFLSSLELLNGRSFLFLSDLGKPDALLVIGGLTINILPVLMTAINILSSSIYTQNLGVKDKLQLYGMALVFLVLLYNSPSGLVIYWTLNNLFSLGKSIVGSTKKPALVKSATLSVLGMLILVYALCAMEAFSFNQSIVILVAACFQIPSILFYIKHRSRAQSKNHDENGQTANPILFLGGCLMMALLSGVLIPASVIANSPAEFIVITDYRAPVIYVVQAFALGIGFFIIWPGLFYYLAGNNIKKKLDIAIWVICVCSLINYMLFGTKLGLLNRQLQYANTPVFTTKEYTINAEVCLLAASILIILCMKKKTVMRIIMPVLLFAVIGLSVKNVTDIQTQMPEIKTAIDAGEADMSTIRLSRSGKNVVVIMMDRSEGCFIPYAFQEKPELMQQFDGFTWYPNTISYGPATNTGVPAVYGGYEYIPEEMNRRSDMRLVDKQNEALKLMPVLFDNAGYQVTVCDPTYANYCWIPDVSIYNEFPDIVAFNIENGKRNEYTEGKETQFEIWKRNFFCFSMMKLSPLVLQSVLYQDGTYFSPDRYGRYLIQSQVANDISNAKGFNEMFMKAYSAIGALPNLTQIVDTDKNSFFMIGNSTTHDLSMLQEPEYEPAFVVDNTEYDQTHSDRFFVDGREMVVNKTEQMKAYHVNMAALLKMGQWFEYLKSEGIYDNTRIIIVADHGISLRCFDDMIFSQEKYGDTMKYNPLFLVKDFDSHGFHRNDQFMTNADTPLLALEGLIENPVNPFTGKPLSDSTKREDEQHLFFTEQWQTTVNNGNTFLPGTWLSLSGHNIFDMSSWRVLGDGINPQELQGTEH